MSVEPVKLLRCIYCLEFKEVGEFNREHVVHDSLGTFEPHNLIIQPGVTRCCVCRVCNNEFGRTIDQDLGRDSIEALLRFIYGIKDSIKIHELGSKRLKFRLADGCRVILSVDDRGILARYIPQLKVWNKATKNDDYFVLIELDHLVQERERYDFHSASIIGQNSRKLNALIDAVKKMYQDLGLRLVLEEGLQGEPTIENIEFQGLIDKVIQRAIAKIAFNYLSYNLENISPALIYSTDFNGAREFIKSGTLPHFEVVSITQRPLFSKSDFNGHAVSIEAGRNKGTQKFIGHVTLFNSLTWQIILTDDFKGLHYDVDCAHRWDLDSREVAKIFGIKRNYQLL